MRLNPNLIKDITILVLILIIVAMGFKYNQQRNTINRYNANELRIHLWDNSHYAYTGRLNPKEIEKCLEINYGKYY